VDSAPARPIDPTTFEELAARHRREIQVHCYRMLGSYHDAEEALQDTLLSAWRGRDTFAGRASFRTWLYRIATNTCLRALERRRSRGRLLPTQTVPSGRFKPLGDPDHETAWLEPYPDALLPDVSDPEPGPAARYEAREAVRLAFMTVVQELPPRQRAVLLLRDVVGLTGDEAAASLDVSIAAANSALQRARATIRRRFPSGRPPATRVVDRAHRDLLERYVRAWEACDVDGFVELLVADAAWSMPPWPEWYVGREAIAAFLGWVWSNRGGRRERLVPTMANGSPAFGYYRSVADGSDWQGFAIQVLDIGPEKVTAITNFVDSRLFDALGLPPRPPA
jgi:RNA polymerase sigma-70 factor (ECF subfamily)